MASSPSSGGATADDSFKERVEKIFGSLTSSSVSSPTQQRPPSSLQSALWSLSDDDVDRKKLKRDTSNSDCDEVPSCSSFNDPDDVSNKVAWREGMDADESDIRSSIGFDRTLDNEEEEDEDDKVAIGKENNTGEHCIHNKDQRADHMAAKIRLQEDEVEAQKLSNASRGSADTQLKSILKRKDINSDSMSLNKRVRFDPDSNMVCEVEESEQVEDDDDHMSNDTYDPSDYNCYGFDSSTEVEVESNTRAIMDFFTVDKESSFELQNDDLADLPKSATFVPRNGVGDLKAAILKALTDCHEVEKDEEEDRNQLSTGIAPEESNEYEAGAAEENEAEVNAALESVASREH
ncbi:uncharacterized protein LOC126673779 [Mercurialis annua]|uniref:uncharacterized protein LOC126673779 n=1 Tax=Mercurialis annua TaxID=3986 RepID=UPI0021605EBF|nr:uncharacterized protein LOC126673779 [Mercurialis annua]